MFPIINIGPLAIQAPGFILLLSFILGLWLTTTFAKNLGTNSEGIENMLLIGLISGIFSARIGYFLKNPSLLSDNPLSLVSLTPSMLDASFGILVGLIVVMIYAQKKNLPLWPTLDSLVPFLILLFAGIHLSNFASGDAFGLETQLPWGIELWNASRHPVQLYALLLAAVLLIWVLAHTKGLKSPGFLQSGSLFLLTLAALGFIMLFTRAFVEQKILLGKLDLYQLMGMLTLLLAVGVAYFHLFQQRKYIEVLILMGSNQNGDVNLPLAISKMSEHQKIRRKSSVYQTEPVKDGTPKTQYLNQVLQIITETPIIELHEQLKTIENELGRDPKNRKSIPIDLDILTYNGDVIIQRGLHIPDPDLIQYRYIAQPVAEIMPDFRHPASGQPIASILEKMRDDSQVIKLNEVENEPSG